MHGLSVLIQGLCICQVVAWIRFLSVILLFNDTVKEFSFIVKAIWTCQYSTILVLDSSLQLETVIVVNHEAPFKSIPKYAPLNIY